MISKDIQKFISHTDDVLESEGIEAVIDILKTSGITLNMFHERKRTQKIKLVINHLFERIDLEEKEKISNLIKESACFTNLYDLQDKLKNEYFRTCSSLREEIEVASYLISLEKFLRQLTSPPNEVNTETYVARANIFDSAIESTGMILKSFIYSKRPFAGSNKNISPKALEASEKHLIFSSYWSELNDIIEYWKYSDISISRNDEGKLKFNIMDSDFELNNHISNERFLNLREGWQFEEVGRIGREYSGKSDKQIEGLLSESQNRLNYLFSTLYFGSPLLEEKINGIELKRWIDAYQLLIDESKKFLKNYKENKVYSIQKFCLSKSRFEWRKLFKQNGFSKEESNIVVEIFTFNKRSLDLVDCPFVEIDDKLIIIPSLTSQVDVSRALASNFLSREINLDFKGQGFEDRTKALFDLNGITNGGLYKKANDTEYECDVAFLLDNDIFFVECKAHVQPFTTRQHASHLYKLYKETNQINRIADFYSSNLKYFKEQLNLNDNFFPRNIYRIILTTSMIGSPLFINGVYIIDESSFTMFINRRPPSLKYFDHKKGVYQEYRSGNFDEFNGQLTSRKMINFLNSPSQVEIFRDFYRKKEYRFELWDIIRNYKVNQTTHIGVVLTDSDKSLINKHFRGISLENIDNI